MRDMQYVSNSDRSHFCQGVTSWELSTLILLETGLSWELRTNSCHIIMFFNCLLLETQKYTTRGEAELCILLMIHHEANLSCVCIRYTTKRSWVVYLPIHHEAKLSCVCLRILTVSSCSVGEQYYTTTVVYFAVGDKVISNGLKSPIYRVVPLRSLYGGFQTVGDHFISNGKIHNRSCIIIYHFHFSVHMIEYFRIICVWYSVITFFHSCMRHNKLRCVSNQKLWGNSN